MSLEIVKSEDFRRDLHFAAEWYVNREGEDLARRYLLAVDATLKRLAAFPSLGVPCRYRHPLLAGLRWLVVDQPFGVHLVFYRVFERHLDAFRALNGHRDLPRRLLDPPDAED